MNMTAFPKIEKALESKIKTIDSKAFNETKMGSCAELFHQCFGMCCSLHVGITSQEKKIYEDLVKNKKHLFDSINIKLPEKIIATDTERNIFFIYKKHRGFKQLLNIILKMLSSSDKFSILNINLFRDFSHTCVFAMPDGACSLQKIAELEGKHPWFYKPINCWKYPLKINSNGVLSMCDTNANKFFPCNMECNKNYSSCEVLKDEINFLGKIIKIDILKAVNKTKV